MRIVALILALACLPVIALGGGKPTTHVTPPPPDPDVLRQGGDTIETAILIDYQGSPYLGTTTGYTHDYDEACPYEGSTAPDVVYALEVPGLLHETWVFDLYGSSYDTKIYVYDSSGALVGCNDDFYSDYTSRLDICFTYPDTYYIVIDGYGNEHGDYQLNLSVFVGALVVCPPGFWPEGEVLENEILDTFNCGCICADQIPRIQALPPDADGNLNLCGSLG